MKYGVEPSLPCECPEWTEKPCAYINVDHAFGLHLWLQSALEDFPLSPKLANIWLDWHSVKYFKQIYR